MFTELLQNNCSVVFYLLGKIAVVMGVEIFSGVEFVEFEILTPIHVVDIRERCLRRFANRGR